MVGAVKCYIQLSIICILMVVDAKRSYDFRNRSNIEGEEDRAENRSLWDANAACNGRGN